MADRNSFSFKPGPESRWGRDCTSQLSWIYSISLNFLFFFFLYLSTPVSPVRLISRILKELGTWSLLTVECDADYAAITRYKETKYRRRRHCFTFCLGMAQPVQKYTNYRPNVRLEVHVGRLIAFKRQSVLRHEMLLFVMCKAKSYFCLECFNKPH